MNIHPTGALNWIYKFSGLYRISAKRLRHIILRFSRISLRPQKIKLAKCLVYVCIESILGPQNSKYDQTAKIMRLKITVVICRVTDSYYFEIHQVIAKFLQLQPKAQLEFFQRILRWKLYNIFY